MFVISSFVLMFVLSLVFVSFVTVPIIIDIGRCVVGTRIAVIVVVAATVIIIAAAYVIIISGGSCRVGSFTDTHRKRVNERNCCCCLSATIE